MGSMLCLFKIEANPGSGCVHTVLDVVFLVLQENRPGSPERRENQGTSSQIVIFGHLRVEDKVMANKGEFIVESKG